MTRRATAPLDPNLDLSFERIVDVPRELVWKAWTTPELVTQWFTPQPWKTTSCSIDLRPGGAFSTTMHSPDGESFPNEGCYLEVLENETLVWTSVLGADYRPNTTSPDDLPMTASIELEDAGGKTKYRATVRHADAQQRARHEAMGFHTGWGTALDQLVALMKKV